MLLAFNKMAGDRQSALGVPARRTIAGGDPGGEVMSTVARAAGGKNG
jgi:hypothetical protein